MDTTSAGDSSTVLTGVSLFAGVGGFDIAMQRTGIDVRAAVEIDPKCREILARHFPQTTLFADVKEVTGDELRATGFVPQRGIITGGFPCQDLSVAGRREGLAGARSGLFWEIVRLLDETQSRYFVIENVPGLLTSNGGRDMGIVVGTLAELGYGVAWRVLDAQHFGVPQRRRRVFIVGCLGDPAGPAEVLLEPEGSGWDLAAGNQAGKEIAGTLGGGTPGGGPRIDTDRMTFIPVAEEKHEPKRSVDQGGHLVAASVFGMTGFASYQPGVTTLTASDHKRSNKNIVIQERHEL